MRKGVLSIPPLWRPNQLGLLRAPGALGTSVNVLGALMCSYRSIFTPTPAALFDLKQYEKEKRKRRELEKAGIDPEDDEPWVAPEEQQRIDEEEAQRRAEEAERVKVMLEQRALEDAEKRKKFKEFRARQIAMSKQRREQVERHKEDGPVAHNHRLLHDVGGDTESPDAEPVDATAVASESSAGAPSTDTASATQSGNPNPQR